MGTTLTQLAQALEGKLKNSSLKEKVQKVAGVGLASAINGLKKLEPRFNQKEE